jgi:hypothetical protein
MSASRLVDSSSCTVRLLISSWKALRTTRLSWLAPALSSRPTLRMYSCGSVMRQRTYQSITTRCFSAVSMGSVSTLSSVSRRLSMYDTFWNGGGSLKLKPRLGDDFLDLAECIDHAELPLVDHEQGGASSARTTSSEETINPILFMVRPRLAGLTVTRTGRVARA